MSNKNNTATAVQGTVKAKTNTNNRPNIENPAKDIKLLTEGKKDEASQEPNSTEQLPKVETFAPAAVIEKAPLTVAERLKALELLQVKKTQYENLLNRIGDLEDFEVKQMEENDELQENPFAGCKLLIMDGKNGQFVTTTPNLIRMVAGFLKDACLTKKSELESQLVFPN